MRKPITLQRLSAYATLELIVWAGFAHFNTRILFFICQ